MNISLPVCRVDFHLPVTTTEVKLWLRNIVNLLGSSGGHPVWNPPWWLFTTFDSLHRISVGHICYKPTLLGIAKVSTRGRCCIFSGSLLISSCELIGSLCQACLMGACDIPCRDGMIDNMYDPGHACQLKINLQSLVPTSQLPSSNGPWQWCQPPTDAAVACMVCIYLVTLHGCLYCLAQPEGNTVQCSIYSSQN